MLGHENDFQPATLGSTARAGLVLHCWCKACRHRANLEPGEQAERHGADLPLRPDWVSRLTCSRGGGREVYFIVEWLRRV